MSEELPTLSVNYDLASNIAGSILQSMMDHNLTIAEGAAASALVIGHLLSEDDLDDEKAIKFVEFIIQNAGMYFAEGESN